MLRILAIASLTTGFSCAHADLTLATGGQTDYRITIDPDATAAEQHAAAELASLLQQVTGAEFPVDTVDALPEGKTIVVGPGPAAEALAPDVDFDALAPDGTVIRSSGENLLLAGDRPRGTLYAVYSFLEDEVGCRWWSSTASEIPSRPTLTVPELNRTYIPPLEYREVFWSDAFDGDWAARNKSNGLRARLEEHHGGQVTYGGPFMVHTFNQFFPTEQYFEEHPEWFSERGGERMTGRNQLCLTNQALKDAMLGKVMAAIEADPTASIVSVSQNDWDGHCLCQECKALEDLEESPAGPLLHFVNYVAERVGETYPDVAIDTLAYQYTRKPPKFARPLPNVIVRLCSIECDFLKPLASGERNESFRADIEGWSKICDRLYVWDYTTNFSHYMIPHPNYWVLGPNVRFFVEHGVAGIFEQGAYQSPGGEMAQLKAWVLAKVLWDPSRDADELVDEFLNGYYGAAAPQIRQHMDLAYDGAMAADHNLRCFSPVNASFLDLDLLAKSEELFDQAEAAVADDADVLNRVQIARLGIRYVWGRRWRELSVQARFAGQDWPGPDDMATNTDTFMAVARKNEITKISEGSPIETFEQRTTGLNRMPSPVPPGCEDLAQTDYLDLQDDGFHLGRDGQWVSLVEDAKASDGAAARMPGSHHEWATQQWLDLPGGGEFACYASIRVEKKADTGGAFTFGIYHMDQKKSLATGGVACEEIEDGEYQTYELGTVPLDGALYIYVAPTDNPDGVEALWVDRFWIVRQTEG
ncbi:MAG TPA: DUF4838 domain-containing protein [Armatimonadota bacterium]|nr:DUF4838 domain-containing protein [Armatimonadota bacterium]